METKIRFRPISKIRRQIDGELRTVLIPKYSYDGIKFSDGTIWGTSPVTTEPIELSENHIIIEKLVPKNI